jgi:hypothetical protein
MKNFVISFSSWVNLRKITRMFLVLIPCPCRKSDSESSVVHSVAWTYTYTYSVNQAAFLIFVLCDVFWSLSTSTAIYYCYFLVQLVTVILTAALRHSGSLHCCVSTKPELAEIFLALSWLFLLCISNTSAQKVAAILTRSGSSFVTRFWREPLGILSELRTGLHYLPLVPNSIDPVTLYCLLVISFYNLSCSALC